MNAIYIYRIARWLYCHHIPVLPKLLYYFIFLLYNSSIPYTAEIGKGTKLGYGGMGVVIHSRARVGENCVIAQQVTIGGRSGLREVPSIGDNVYLGAGAKILGDVEIGNNAIVGANAVVLRDIPPCAVAAGVPAKIIKQNINPRDYIIAQE